MSSAGTSHIIIWNGDHSPDGVQTAEMAVAHYREEEGPDAYIHLLSPVLPPDVPVDSYAAGCGEDLHTLIQALSYEMHSGDTLTLFLTGLSRQDGAGDPEIFDETEQPWTFEDFASLVSRLPYRSAEILIDTDLESSAHSAFSDDPRHSVQDATSDAAPWLQRWTVEYLRGRPHSPEERARLARLFIRDPAPELRAEGWTLLISKSLVWEPADLALLATERNNTVRLAALKAVFGVLDTQNRMQTYFDNTKSLPIANEFDRMLRQVYGEALPVLKDKIHLAVSILGPCLQDADRDISGNAMLALDKILHSFPAHGPLLSAFQSLNPDDWDLAALLVDNAIPDLQRATLHVLGTVGKVPKDPTDVDRILSCFSSNDAGVRANAANLLAYLPRALVDEHKGISLLRRRLEIETDGVALYAAACALKWLGAEEFEGLIHVLSTQFAERNGEDFEAIGIALLELYQAPEIGPQVRQDILEALEEHVMMGSTEKRYAAFLVLFTLLGEDRRPEAYRPVIRGLFRDRPILGCGGADMEGDKYPSVRLISTIWNETTLLGEKDLERLKQDPDPEIKIGAELLLKEYVLRADPTRETEI